MRSCGASSRSGFLQRESNWGLGYGGDSWAETEMGFNGMSAFQPGMPQGHCQPGLIRIGNKCEPAGVKRFEESAFRSGRDCPAGTSYNGQYCEPSDEPMEATSTFNGKSAFRSGRDCPAGYSFDGRFCVPPFAVDDGFRSGGHAAYGIEHYKAFADDDNALADYESYDDCFDDGTRRMYLGSDPRGIERRDKKYTRTLFGSEQSMSGIGYMPRHTPQSGNDTSMARVLRPVGNTLQRRRWVFDPSTRRWLQQ